MFRTQRCSHLRVFRLFPSTSSSQTSGAASWEAWVVAFCQRAVTRMAAKFFAFSEACNGVVISAGVREPARMCFGLLSTESALEV